MVPGVTVARDYGPRDKVPGAMVPVGMVLGGYGPGGTVWEEGVGSGG